MIQIVKTCFFIECIGILLLILGRRNAFVLSFATVFLWAWAFNFFYAVTTVPAYIVMQLSGRESPLGTLCLAIVGTLLYFVFYLLLQHLVLREANGGSIKSAKKHYLDSNLKIPNIIIAAIVFLVLGLIIKLIAIFSAPTSVYDWGNYLASIFLLLFLIVSAFNLKPKGFIAFTIIAATSCILVFVFVYVFYMIVISLLIAIIAFFLLVALAFCMLDIFAVLFFESVSAFAGIAFYIPLIAAAPAVATATTGDMMNKGISTTAKDQGIKSGHLKYVILNIILLFVFSIPLLSATTGLCGIFRCKPAFVAERQFINWTNILTATEAVGTNSESFRANTDLFKDGNLNCLQYTKQYNSDADDYYSVILHDGVLYILENETTTCVALEACPIKNSINTVILHDSDKAFVLGDEELFILTEDNEHYMQGYYPWRRKYLKMNEDEQMDYIYHLISEECNGNDTAPLKTVALIKLAAQRGQLVYFNPNDKLVYFASTDEKGFVTFYKQTKENERTILATVASGAKSMRTPYMYDIKQDYIACMDGSKATIVTSEGEVSVIDKVFAGGNFYSWNSFYTEEGEYCQVLQNNEGLYIYNCDNRKQIHTKLDPYIAENSSGLLKIRNGFYQYYYQDNDLLRKLTFIKESFVDNKDESFKSRFIDNSYQIIRWHGAQINTSSFEKTSATNENGE